MTESPAKTSPPRALTIGSAALLPLSYACDAWFGGTAGGFLRLAFAATTPGLLACSLLWRFLADSPTTCLLRSFVMSPVILGLTSLAVAAPLGIPPDGATAVAAPLIAALSVLACAWRPADRGDSTAAERHVVGVPWWPLLVLAAAAIAIVAEPGARTLGAAPEHAALVARLAVGGLPAEDPGLAGAASTEAWLYHWVVASQATISGLAPGVVAAFISITALLAFVGLGMRLAYDGLGLGLTGTPRGRVFLGCAVLAVPFAVNWFAPALFAFGGGLIDATPSSWGEPRHFLQVAAGPGNRRIVTLLARVLEVGPLALALASFAVLLEAARPDRRGGAVVVLLASFSLSALNPHAGLVGLITLVSLRGANRLQLLAAMAGAALAWPLAEPVLFASAASPDLGRSGLILHHLQGVVWNAPALVLALSLAPFCWGDPQRRRLWWATFVALGFGVLLALPDRREAELILLASLPAGLLLLRAGVSLAAHLPRTAAAIGLVALGLALAGHALTLRSVLGSQAVRRAVWLEQGEFLTRRSGPDRAAAYAWIRAHTPPSAVLVEAPKPGIGSDAAAATGRAAFLTRTRRAADSNPDRRRRRPLIEGLVGGAVAPGPLAARILQEIPGREVYLLLESRVEPVFEPVFEQGRIRIERLEAGE